MDIKTGFLLFHFTWLVFFLNIICQYADSCISGFNRSSTLLLQRHNYSNVSNERHRNLAPCIINLKPNSTHSSHIGWL